MNKLNKKLQLNKEVIARLDQKNIFGGEPPRSFYYDPFCNAIGQAVGGMSDMLAGTCGGAVTDDCGFTGYTGKTDLGVPEICWGHECW